ncbi:hypothetical protein RE474_07125 [Methanolobus sediminis]|uniref:Uncharacterized protein n=1 Tax=Methanolobus sediminis TaxID=3072978 RepID=A0AA51YHW5_9EURY|nr:hypothetical protein [Methanolobus sediminis]WMW23876.1 hypothetical protein RE474_07125 [Methanolobus sediminis]
MKVPLHIRDYEFIPVIIAIGLVFMPLSLIDHIYRSIWTYLSVVLTVSVILMIIHLRSYYEIIINNNEIIVIKLLFKDLKIPVEKIIEISDFNNTLHKYRKPYFLILGLMVLIVAVMNGSNGLESIEKYGFYEASNISLIFFLPLMFVIILYNSYRMSHYPTAIKVKADPGFIGLYPENEEKYLLLKEKLDTLLR